MKNLKYVVEQFLNDRLVIVDFPHITPLIDPLFNGFKTLLKTPVGALILWQIHHSELSKRADHGLIFPKGGEYDEKWMFMYRTGLLADYFRLQRLTEIDYLEYKLWFNVLHQTHRMLQNVVFEFTEELDAQLPGYNLLEQVNSPLVEDTHPLRLLQYLHGPASARGVPLAKGHLDLGFITVQAYASHEGLDFIPNYDEHLAPDFWKRIPYTPKSGTLALFPGKKFAKATGGRIPAMYHEVGTQCGCNREALIFFSHTAEPNEESR